MAENNQQAPQSVLTNDDKRNLNLAVLSETTNVMNPVEYEQIKKLAKDFWSAGALAKSFQNEQQIVMAMLAGREMGMTFNEAVNDLYFVNGKLNVHGKATPAALRRHYWQIKYADETPESCTAILKNTKTGEEVVDTFTFAEAEQSGFVKDSSGKVKAGWLPGANRRRKLRYGVLSLIIHTYTPEVLGAAAGIGEYSEDYAASERYVIDGQATETRRSDDDRKARMIAAEAKHKELNGKGHVPKAVKTVEKAVKADQSNSDDAGENNVTPVSPQEPEEPKKTVKEMVADRGWDGNKQTAVKFDDVEVSDEDLAKIDNGELLEDGKK